MNRDEFLQEVSEGVALSPHLIVNHNLHSIYHFHRCEPMRSVYARADACFIDGMPLIFWGRWLGEPLRPEHRITVLDWIGPLLELAQTRAWRVYALGGRPEVVGRSQDYVAGRYPGLEFRAASGYFDQADPQANHRVVSDINAYRPDVLLVGMGMPRQETWLAHNLDRLEPCVAITVGAIFDYLTGEIPTPPRWTGRLGVEWLARLLMTPGRVWQRYLLEPWSLIPHALRDLLRKRRVAPRLERPQE